MHVEERVIRKLLVEPGFRDEPPGVGLEVSDADTMLVYLSGKAYRAFRFWRGCSDAETALGDVGQQNVNSTL